MIKQFLPHAQIPRRYIIKLFIENSHLASVMDATVIMTSPREDDVGGVGRVVRFG
jgi:hypothetical protein